MNLEEIDELVDEGLAIRVSGIADIYGLESFCPEQPPAMATIKGKKVFMKLGVDPCPPLGILDMRARFNEHRKPMVYRCTILKSDFQPILDKLLDDPAEAMLMLKEKALTVGTLHKKDFKRWEKLPMPEMGDW